MPTFLRARVVYCVDRPPIDGGVVTIDGERIVAVGKQAEPSAEVRDLGDVALLPGFVNAHTHLEFSHLHEPLGRPGMPLVDWLPMAIAERQNRGHAAADSIAAGVRESIAVGTCAIGEISTADATAYSVSRRTDNLVRRLAIDGQDCPSYGDVDLTVFHEVIGFSRARAASALAALEERLSAARHSHAAGISPHAPYTVSPSLLRMLVLLAQRLNIPVAMHLAESEEELQLVEHGAGPFRELLEARSMWDATAIPAGAKPLTYLRMLADASRALVIHGNYLDHAEYSFLAEHADRMSLIFCPRTHAYFAHPPYPLAELLAGGVRVALGTDSRASNPDLSVLAEMRHVARTHSGVSPDATLRLGTLSAAEALGRAADHGSITPGKLANLVAVPLSDNVAGSAQDRLASLLVSDFPPAKIWLRGRES